MPDINSVLERIISLYDSGRDPMSIMQTMTQRLPNVQQMGVQFQNMTQGRSTTEVLMQLAKQGGASQQNLDGLARILGVNK